MGLLRHTMRVRTMKTRDYLRWAQENGIRIRYGKGGETVLYSALRLTKMAINARKREIGPETILETCRKFALAQPHY